MSDEFDLDLIGLFGRAVPQGPDQGDDTALTATGIVREIDAPKRRVRVGLRAGEAWLPAVAGRYKIGATCAVLLDPTASRPVRVLGPIDPRDPILLGTVTAGPTGGNLTVNVEGTSYVLPSPMGAYTIGASAYVLLNDWGVPVYVTGPSSLVAGGGAGSIPGGGGSVVTATATIGPQSTGTYRSGYGWDTWGNDVHGGVADVYQGEAYGSGPLTGLACFGDQIVNLGAIAIQSARLSVRRNGSGSGASALTVQGSPHGSRPGGAPSGAGSTATSGGIGTSSWGAVDLPSDVCEALRTGTAKGLLAIGSAYAGFGGTTTPGSFTLAIQYTRNA